MHNNALPGTQQNTNTNNNNNSNNNSNGHNNNTHATAAGGGLSLPVKEMFDQLQAGETSIGGQQQVTSIEAGVTTTTNLLDSSSSGIPTTAPTSAYSFSASYPRAQPPPPPYYSYGGYSTGIPRAGSQPEEQVTLEKLIAAFLSVVTRHGHNSLDPTWLKAKDMLVIAWHDLQADIQARNNSRPYIQQAPASFPNALTTTATPVIIQGGTLSQSPITFTKETISSRPIIPFVAPINLPYRPPLHSIVHILQGRVFGLCLHDIPLGGGVVSITIRNYGGSLHGEDVTDNFVLSRALKSETGGRGSKMTWKLRSEYSTSKLPYVRRQIPQMDKQTVHSVAFTLSSTGHPDVTVMWKKFLLVLGRGSSGEHDILKSCDLNWEELEPVDTKLGGGHLPPSLLIGASASTGPPPISMASGAISAMSRKRDKMEDVGEGEEGEEPSSTTSSVREKRKREEESLPEKAEKKHKGEEGELAIADETEDEEDENGERKPKTKKSITMAREKAGNDLEEEEEGKEAGDIDRKNEKGEKEQEEEEEEEEGNGTGEKAPPVVSPRAPNAAAGRIVPRGAASDMMEGEESKNEPLETFTTETRSVRIGVPPTASSTRQGANHVGGSTQSRGNSTTSSIPGGGVIPPTPERQLLQSEGRQDALHLSIRLLDVESKQPIPWGSLVPDNSHLAIAVHNPSADQIRVVCHVCDKEEKRLPIDGKMVLDLNAKDSSVMCKFRAYGKDGPVQLHFLAAALPLVPGRPLYHTRLYINVEKPKAI